MKATILTLSRQGGCHVCRPDHVNGLVLKEGFRVRQSERDAMELAVENTKVKMPPVVYANFDGPRNGMLLITFVEGRRLDGLWKTLDEKSKDPITPSSGSSLL